MDAEPSTSSRLAHSVTTARLSVFCRNSPRRASGGLVTDPENEGSFDYFPPYNPDGSLGWENIPDVAGHVLYDVIPWILWGN
jgi:hypothetical protein